MGGEFATSEVVSLADDLHLVRHIGHPHAIERYVAGEGVGGDGRGLDLTLRVLARISAEQRHARGEGIVAYTQTDDAVGEIGGQLGSTGTGHCRRADGIGHLGTRVWVRSESLGAEPRGSSPLGCPQELDAVRLLRG